MDERDYPFLEAINEALSEARDQISMAREADKVGSLGIRLKLAQQCVQSAIEIYGEMVAEIKERKCEPIK
jgi:hypothetical protein